MPTNDKLKYPVHKIQITYANKIHAKTIISDGKYYHN